MIDLRPLFVRKNDDLRFGFSLRTGGVSREPFGMNVSFRVGDQPESVQQNRERFFRSVGCVQDQVALPIQCHSSKVVFADGAGSYLDVDGLVTNRSEVFLAVTIADCVPIFLFDPRTKAIGMIHAGWKGTARRIIRNAVSKMDEHFQSLPENILAYLGPAAHSCCYVVGPEVAERFRPEVIDGGEKVTTLDLVKENTLQLLEAGLPVANIEVSKYCTICNPEFFHSYRRDGQKSGRMMGILGLTGKKRG